MKAPKKQEWFVVVIRSATRTTEKTLGPYPSESIAERADDGVNRNLNHEEFHTVVRPRPGQQK